MSLKTTLNPLVHSFLSFVKKDFHVLSYLYTLCFILICIFINYKFGFYQNIIRPSYYSGQSMAYIPLFYAFIYFTAAIPALLLQKRYDILSNYKFYLKIIFIIGIYGMTIGYFEYQHWTFPNLFSIEKDYLIRMFSQMKAITFLTIPFVFMKLFIDKKTVEGYYGLAKITQHVKGYVVLFLLLLPFLILTSFTPDFLNAYPQFMPWFYNGAFNMPVWLYTSIFEVVYAVDFVMVELVFRGILVIGMVAIMGPKAVLPMVALYAAIHFGKPIGETLSSIFGGYILGALAYQTKHIWGGVIVHICIALTMEIMGFIHYYK